MKVLAIVLASALSVSTGMAATLVAEYQFQNSGNLGADTSANGNNAVVSGSVSHGTGPFSGWSAAVFSGGVIQRTSNLAGFNPANGFSYTAWVKLNSANAAQYNGILSQDSGSCCFNRLLVSPSEMAFINVGGHYDVAVGPSLPESQWFFLALTGGNEAGNSGNATGHVYVNGTEVSGSPVTFSGNPHVITNPGTLNTYLGAGEGGGPYRLVGSLADVRIYQGELSASDVLSIYQFASSLPGTPVPPTVILMLVGLACVGFYVASRKFAHTN